MNRLVFLKSVPLFAGLSLDDLVAVDRALIQETYLPGEAVVTEGETGDRFYIVFRGEVAVSKQIQGQRRELARLGPGQVFGEMSLFDHETRSATVTAASETEVLALDHDRFHNLSHQRPVILTQICKVLVTRLRHAIS